MVSIMLLTIAIIPMVGMFDAGLNAASTSGNYDRARMLANQQLERAKSLRYEDVRSNFPVSGSTPDPTYTSPNQTAGVPSGLTSYTLTKRFVDRQFADSSTDQGLMRVTVTVTWGEGKSYSTTGVVGR
jgi:Tfp pilus assembly protein PilV